MSAGFRPLPAQALRAGGRFLGRRHLWTQTLMDFQGVDAGNASPSMSYTMDYGDGIDVQEVVASAVMLLAMAVYGVEVLICPVGSSWRFVAVMCS
eukprot:COSAG04_NODE_5551_length_1572_cov_19.944331_1_plen_95_part_00